MTFALTIRTIRGTFSSPRELLAKATRLRTGDVLTGEAAQSAEEGRSKLTGTAPGGAKCLLPQGGR